jgi:hypothetical protein
MSVSIHLHDVSLSQASRVFYQNMDLPDIHLLFLDIDENDKPLIFRLVEEILDVSKELNLIYAADHSTPILEEFDFDAKCISLLSTHLFQWLDEVRDILRSPAALKKGRFKLESLLIISRVLSFLRLADPSKVRIKSVYLEIINVLAALSVYRYSVSVLAQIIADLKNSLFKRSQEIKLLLELMEDVMNAWITSCKTSLPTDLEVRHCI